jgi:hypothetical protein
MGKPGQKISLAREKVLEILETENACSAWFKRKDPNPAASFRTLSFLLDRNRDDFVVESRDLGPSPTYRHPYVAKVFQGNGPYATVTINRQGAFFSGLATAVEVPKDGGPIHFHGQRMLHVGPYVGDTLEARVVTLLHEFGHAVDLLPPDENNVDGKSVRNTEEVLRFCRAEVDARVKHKVFSAAR